MKNHGNILSKAVIRVDLYFKQVILGMLWRVDFRVGGSSGVRDASQANDQRKNFSQPRYNGGN